MRSRKGDKRANTYSIYVNFVPTPINNKKPIRYIFGRLFIILIFAVFTWIENLTTCQL